MVVLYILPDFCQSIKPLVDVGGDRIVSGQSHVHRDLLLGLQVDIPAADALCLLFRPSRPAQAVGPPGSFDAQFTEIKLHLLEVPLFCVDSLHGKAHLVTSSTARGHPAHALGALFGSVPDALDLLLLGLDLLRQISAL